MRLAASERQAENTAMSTVPTKVRSLSVADRLRLLEEIWDSLAETPEAIPVTDAHRRLSLISTTRTAGIGRRLLGSPPTFLPLSARASGQSAAILRRISWSTR